MQITCAMWLLRHGHEGTCARACGPGGLGTPHPAGVRASPRSSSGVATQTRCQASDQQCTDKPTATREAQPAVLPSRVASGSCTCAETPVTGGPCHGVLLPGIGTVCVRVTRGLLMCCLPLRKECGLPMKTKAVLGWEARVLQGPHVLREVMHHTEPET